MHPVRIIAKIDIKENSIVKGIGLEGLRKLGNPYDFAKYYFENNIDEIIFHDVTASLFGNNCLTEIINKVCKNLFIPITIGGGLRNLKDIENILKRGADRVMLNSAVVKDISFLEKAAKIYGSSNIAINIEYKEINDKYLIFYEYGRQPTKINLFQWIKKLENAGAGEIVLTSIDKEGYGEGFDYNVVKKLKNICKIPITIHGGCSNIGHIKKLLKYNKKISGIVLSSILHYNYLKKKNIYNLSVSSKWENFSIKSIKNEISKNNILIRK